MTLAQLLDPTRPSIAVTVARSPAARCGLVMSDSVSRRLAAGAGALA